MPLSYNTMRLAAVFTLVYRVSFGTIIFLAAKESDTPFLQWTLLTIMSILFTYGFYRFVKMMGYIRNLVKMNKALDNKN